MTILLMLCLNEVDHGGLPGHTMECIHCPIRKMDVTYQLIGCILFFMVGM